MSDTLRENIIHGLRSKGWSRIDAENEADDRIAAMQADADTIGLHDAAALLDELNRLRAENERLERGLKDMAGEWKTMRAELASADRSKIDD